MDSGISFIVDRTHPVLASGKANTAKTFTSSFTLLPSRNFMIGFVAVP